MTLPRAVLDTSVLIQPPRAGLATLVDEVAVSIVSVAELQYGLATASDPVSSLARRRRLDLVLGRHDLLTLDVATTELYGMMAGLVLAAGRSPRPRRFDLLIAASAARHRLPLLTRNAVDLRDLGAVLPVVPVGE